MSKQQKATPRTIVFAGGGTAGHILPAIAIAEQIKQQTPSLEPHFICSTRPIDQRVLKDQPHSPINAAPFALHPARAPRTLISLFKATNRVRARLKQLNAAAVVTTGGFVCPPVAFAASTRKLPVIMLNLDAVPGKANFLLARFATTNLTTADTPQVPTTWQRLNPIVRRSLDTQLNPISQTQARANLSLFPDRNTLLITGGSQGARSINQMLLHTLATDPTTKGAALANALKSQHFQVFHQAGPPSSPEDNTIQQLRSAYAANNIPAKVVDYEPDMPSAYAAASLALTRAGAGTIAELWNAQTPAVLLPYPHHTDNHQAHNAKPLSDAAAAILETDLIEPKLNATNAAITLANLILNPPKLAKLQAAANALTPPQGRQQAASAILNTLQSPSETQKSRDSS